jgi:hypothetical protein
MLVINCHEKLDWFSELGDSIVQKCVVSSQPKNMQDIIGVNLFYEPGVLLFLYLPYLSQWIFGFVVFFFPGAAPNVRKGVLPWHILFGLFVYILALATAELGFLEKLTFLQSSGLDKYGAEAFLVNFTALVVMLFGASVVVAAIAPARLEEPQGYTPIPDNHCE